MPESATRITLSALLCLVLTSACASWFTGEPDPAQAKGIPELETITLHVNRCWEAPAVEAAVESDDPTVVEVQVSLAPNGSARATQVLDQRRWAADENYRLAAEAALKAINDCGFPELAPERYEAWREVILAFDY